MKLLRTILLTLTAVGIAATSAAGVDTGTDADGVILAGHDAVAYFTEGRPVLGNERYTARHNGAVYRFASAANRDRFQADPERYAPVYGGFCAYGTSVGKKFLVDGQAFEIVDGKLYVNKNLKVYKTWRKDIPGNIKKADANWPKIRNIPADEL